MKDFITEFGRSLIDLFAVIILIGIVVLSIGALWNEGLTASITILLGGLIVFILSFYLLYLLIDIKDNTRDINNILKNHFGISQSSIADIKDALIDNVSQKLIDEISKEEFDIEKIKDYIFNNADVNAVDNVGRTPIIVASKQSNIQTLDLIEILIKNGADVNKRDKEGNSVLYYVSTGKNPKKDEIIKLLKDHGAE